MELTLSAAVTRTCSTFTFLNSIFSKNGRIETIQAVIVSDNHRVTLDRFQAEIALFNGSGGELHNHKNYGIINIELQSKMSVQSYQTLSMDKLNTF